MEKIYWTTKTGEKINIDDMSVNHLRNTLKMIIRNATKPKHKGISIAPFSEEEISALEYRPEEDRLWK